jgi:hypothetical protein
VKQSYSAGEITFQGATSGHKVTLSNVQNPVADSDAATKAYVDSQMSGVQLGLSWKDAVRVRTTGNLDATYASGTLTASADGAMADVDGVALASGDRVLVMMQTNAAHNGIYQVNSLGTASSPFTLDRTADANALTGAGDVRRAAAYVEEGTQYSGRGYVQSADGVTTLGTHDLQFRLFATISEVSATDGLHMSGKHIAVHTDSNRGIAIVSDKVAIVDKGVSQSLIGDQAVGTEQIADNSCTASKIPDGAIARSAQFAGQVIDNAALGSLSVSTAKLQTNAVEEAKIKDQNVTRQKIADDAIDGSKLAPDCITASGGALEDACITAGKIAAGNVNATHYAPGSVGETAIGSNAVKQQHIATGAVITSRIAPQNVTTALLAQTSGSEAVATTTIRDDAVTAPKLAEDAVQERNMSAQCVPESALKDGCVSERTLGTFNSLSVNGPVTASAFIAGSSSAGTSSMGLARAVMTKVSFDNNSFPISTNFEKLPNSNACLTFTFNDNISAAFPTYQTAFQTDGTSNTVELVMKAQYFKTDGSETLDSQEYEVDHFGFETGQDTFYPEGSQTVVMKRSNAGGQDLRIGKVWVEAKKNSSGLVQVPQHSDFNLVAIVVADDSSATTIVF